jgi:hypothetical protein
LQLGCFVERSALQHVDQRRVVDRAAGKPQPDPAGAGEALVELRVGLRMHEHRHAEVGRGLQHRPGLPVAEQEVASGAFDEHATQP